MPELPEVETIRARLAPHVTGRAIHRVEILDSRLTRPHDPAAIAAAMTGERIIALERRGKYLIFRFETGFVLLIHLRMTGSLRYVPAGSMVDEEPHRRAVVTLDNGAEVAYHDVRRFGTWNLLESPELAPYLDARIGSEPLAHSFTSRVLGSRLQHRRTPIKAALLDQKTAAGIGNIYADEALWRARIHPRRAAGELGPNELRAVHRSVRHALQVGIARQGATLRDYRTPDGASGGMQREFRVYGREGEPCSRCGTPIEKIRVGGRGTWFCPRCQR